MNHEELCYRAAGWLRGTKRCNPVLSGIASTEEVPDAIGWSSCGSIVVECKTSIMDFYEDKNKYIRWKHPKHGYESRMRRWSKQTLREAGYEAFETAKMGDYRYFLSEPGVLDAKHLKAYPDHGLLYAKGKRMFLIVEAPHRDKPDLDSEVRCLRFALVHLEDNLLRLGCGVTLTEATKFRAINGISLPKAQSVV